MSSPINYKVKYLELRAKYINDIDIAFRLGFEQGAQQAQQQQALDAQAQAEQMDHEQNMAEASGQGGEAPPPGGDGQPSSELDQHISKLESMVGSPDSSPEDIKKSLDAIISLRKSEKLTADLRKSDEAVKGIVQALHKPTFKVGVQAQHNMTANSKSALTMQHKIVSDVFKTWDQEQDRASKDILNVLDIEGLVKE